MREIDSGSGLNQEVGLKRSGDTCWGSYSKCVLNIISLFSAIVEVLMHIGKHGLSENNFKAQTVLGSLESFDFIFMAHLMLTIFGYTNDLCIDLQRKEQDIVNVIRLVSFMAHLMLTIFGYTNDLCIDLQRKEQDIVNVIRLVSSTTKVSRRFVEKATNEHHFRVGIILLEVIDLHLQELDNRFNEKNKELLTCLANLSPMDNFSSFDKEKVLKLASLYPKDFSHNELLSVDDQLEVFKQVMLDDENFLDLHDINSLSKMLVKNKLHETYPLIHLLIKLMLILPVTTASVEKVFSAMTYIKNKLRNSMGD
ncbi:uncharacterized protein LOC110692092 [Chenopodium quinoa]|uniref:uncharacterized protein LOC110692092 n=1 Tax=Chenopodium quinoa TaxID=63459 RepID=UPI000B76D9FB|nr:uncharacterized protein LOC110692092 [Chenopodium quinoa]